MTCSELEHFLHPYLDGEFEVHDQLELEAHLSQCASCARRVHAEKRFREAFRVKAREAAMVPASASLRDAVRTSLEGEQRRAARSRWMQLSAAAAVLALTSGGAYYGYRPYARQRYADDAAARHAKRFPLEVLQATPAEIEGWFTAKLGHRVPVPLFPNARPAGARLLNVQEKQAAYISYDADRPGRIGLFVYADREGDVPFEPLPDADVRRSHGFNVVSWRDEDVVYTLVSDTDDADIRRMLEQPSRAVNAPTPVLPVAPASLER